MYDSMKYSAVTLAFFGDLGLYEPDMTKAEHMDWGYQAGCSFVTEKCLNNQSAPINQTFFCNLLGNAKRNCTYNHRSTGFCRTAEHPSDLPEKFQYFPGRPRLGGAIYGVDYCPIVQYYTDHVCADTAHTADRAKGTYYGPGSRCMVSHQVLALAEGAPSSPSSYLTEMCLRMRCKNGVQVQFSMDGTSWSDCPSDGSGRRDVAASSGFRGLVDCPPARQVCSPDLYFLETTVAPTLPETTTTTTTTTSTTTSGPSVPTKKESENGKGPRVTPRPSTTTTTTTTRATTTPASPAPAAAVGTVGWSCESDAWCDTNPSIVLVFPVALLVILLGGWYGLYRMRNTRIRRGGGGGGGGIELATNV